MVTRSIVHNIYNDWIIVQLKSIYGYMSIKQIVTGSADSPPVGDQGCQGFSELSSVLPSYVLLVHGSAEALLDISWPTLDPLLESQLRWGTWVSGSIGKPPGRGTWSPVVGVLTGQGASCMGRGTQWKSWLSSLLATWTCFSTYPGGLICKMGILRVFSFLHCCEALRR